MSHDREPSKKLAERRTIRDVRGDPIDVWGVRYEKVETREESSLYTRVPRLRPPHITIDGHELIDQGDGYVYLVGRSEGRSPNVVAVPSRHMTSLTTNSEAKLRRMSQKLLALSSRKLTIEERIAERVRITKELNALRAEKTAADPRPSHMK